jgi:2-polyprenyl-3-methyl-5-hydroxy-6-metoxy-1,4-benzoquinol methylase
MMQVLCHLDEAEPVLSKMARPVKPGGRIVVAEFSEEGLALIWRVHRAEEGTHQGRINIKDPKKYLAARGFSKEGRAEVYHNEVAWFRKPTPTAGPTEADG